MHELCNCSIRPFSVFIVWKVKLALLPTVITTMAEFDVQNNKQGEREIGDTDGPAYTIRPMFEKK